MNAVTTTDEAARPSGAWGDGRTEEVMAAMFDTVTQVGEHDGEDRPL